jgi:hypothetical protein
LPETILPVIYQQNKEFGVKNFHRFMEEETDINKRRRGRDFLKDGVICG